ncbi:MAG TPA: hypothetical protein VK047_12690 [Zeimonas sp.]|nr:hypothetical protein [Zeimonas sp.]
MHNQNETRTPLQEDHEARRRKLLRLGAAVPMVVTLRPGASFGASATCLEKGVGAVDQARGEAAEKLAGAPDADEWVRARVDIVELQRIDFEAKGLQDARIEGKYVLGTDGVTYWRVDAGSPGVGPTIASTKSSPRVSDGAGGFGKDAPVSAEYNTSNVTANTVEKRWALIKVDPTTGEPLGYSWEPQAMNGVVLSVGCFSSLNPGLARYDGGFGGIGSFVKRVLGLS